MDKRNVMILEVVQKEQNKRLVTKQYKVRSKVGRPYKNSKAMETTLLELSPQ